MLRVTVPPPQPDQKGEKNHLPQGHEQVGEEPHREEHIGEEQGPADDHVPTRLCHDTSLETARHHATGGRWADTDAYRSPRAWHGTPPESFQKA